MNVAVIYVDILLALNLFIDFLLLTATARVLSLTVKRRRLVAGGLVGSLSSLIMLAPSLPAVFSLLYKLLSAALMVAVAFSFGSHTDFLKRTTVLFVVSAVFSGICTAAYWLLAPAGLFVQSGIVYFDVPPLMLIFFTTLSYAVLCLYDRLTRKRAALGYAYRIEIVDGNNRVMLRALMDSGHSLTDSFSGAPVILAKESAVRCLRDRYDPLTIGSHAVGRIRYIPFSSIGGDGVLAAFRPECVTMYADARRIDISGVWVATTTVLGRGEYDALIGPAIADRAFQQERCGKT